MFRKNKQMQIFNQTDNGMKFNPESYCHTLKATGLSFEERVEALDRVFSILKPSIERQIAEWGKEYNANPDVRKEYRDDYKIQDFIPVIGNVFHEGRNQKKRERNSFFYRKANSEPLPNILSKLYNFYQWTTLPATTMGVLYFLDPSGFH